MEINFNELFGGFWFVIGAIALWGAILVYNLKKSKKKGKKKK